MTVIHNGVLVHHRKEILGKRSIAGWPPIAARRPRNRSACRITTRCALPEHLDPPPRRVTTSSKRHHPRAAGRNWFTTFRNRPWSSACAHRQRRLAPHFGQRFLRIKRAVRGDDAVRKSQHDLAAFRLVFQRRRAPRPAIFPAASASTIASYRTTGPREVFTRYAVFFMQSNCGLFIRWWVPCIERDVQRNHVGLAQQFFQAVGARDSDRLVVARRQVWSRRIASGSRALVRAGQ